MAAKLGQPVIVENNAGAGTAIGAGQVAHSAPDGYTMLISSNTTFTINPALKSKLPYDPLTSPSSRSASWVPRHWCCWPTRPCRPTR